MTRKCAASKGRTLASDAIRWGGDAALPVGERWLYICGWVGAVTYCCYSVYRASNDYMDALNDYFLVPGWRMLGRRKDTSNFEWDFWSGWFLEIWPWFAGHFLISFVSQRLTSKLRDVIFILYSNVTLTFVLGWQPLLLLWGHIGVMYLMTFTRSKVMVWIISVLLLAMLNVDVTVSMLKQLVGSDPFEKKFYLLLFVLAMINLRYTSAAIDISQHRYTLHILNKEALKVQNSEQAIAKTDTYRRNKFTEHEYGLRSRGKRVVIDKETKWKSSKVKTVASLKTGLLDMGVHVFYLPLFFTGPIMTYDLFHEQLHNSPPHPQPVLPRIRSFLRALARVIFWALALELSLHYFYFNCLQLDINLLQRLPLCALAGIGYCHGQFFMVKYVVLFGVPSVIAKVDGLDTPLGPKCIGRIYLYSDMWKYFDRGLYAFLKKYIYIPLGGSRCGVFRQMLASVICFAFVFFWHGAEEYLLVWTSLNLLGITVETLAGKFSELPEVQQWEHNWLSATISRRLRAILAVPLLAMSAIAIFCFFGGRDVGRIFFSRLLIEGFPQSTVLVVVFLYCCVQTSIESKQWENRKEHVH